MKNVMTKIELMEQIKFEDDCGVNTTLQEYICGNIKLKGDSNTKQN